MSKEWTKSVLEQYQKGQCHKMQQLPYCCFDELYWEAHVDNLDKKTTGPSRRTLSR